MTQDNFETSRLRALKARTFCWSKEKNGASIIYDLKLYTGMFKPIPIVESIQHVYQQGIGERSTYVSMFRMYWLTLGYAKTTITKGVV